MANKLYVQAGRACTSLTRNVLSEGMEVSEEDFSGKGESISALKKAGVIGSEDPTIKKETPKLEKSDAKKADAKKE